MMVLWRFQSIVYKTLFNLTFLLVGWQYEYYTEKSFWIDEVSTIRPPGV